MPNDDKVICGIHGNGHAMQLERNSDQIAALLSGWIGEQDLTDSQFL